MELNLKYIPKNALEKVSYYKHDPTKIRYIRYKTGENKCTELRLYDNGVIKSRCYLENGKYHSYNDFMPACSYYNIKGKIVVTMHYYHGILHRFHDMPAVTVYDDTQKISETWYEKGIIKRYGNAPASINYCSYKILTVSYWHNYDGIATDMAVSPGYPL